MAKPDGEPAAEPGEKKDEPDGEPAAEPGDKNDEPDGEPAAEPGDKEADSSEAAKSSQPVEAAETAKDPEGGEVAKDTNANDKEKQDEDKQDKKDEQQAKLDEEEAKKRKRAERFGTVVLTAEQKSQQEKDQRPSKRAKLATNEEVAKSSSQVFSDDVALRLLADILLALKDEGRELPFNASLVNDRMRREKPGWKASKTSFERMGGLLRHAEDLGWLRTVKRRDDVLITFLKPSLLKGDKVGVPSGQTEKPERREETAKKKEGAKGEVLDKDDVDGLLRKHLDKRAAAPAGSGQRRALARTERQEPPVRSTAGVLASDRKPMEGRSETLRKFDTALRDICNEGLHKELPLNASIVSARMRRLFPQFKLEATPFDKYADLLLAAELDAMIKVSKKGDDMLITWLKHKYKVVQRTGARSALAPVAHVAPDPETRRSRSRGAARRCRRGSDEARQRSGGRRRVRKRRGTRRARGRDRKRRRERSSSGGDASSYYGSDSYEDYYSDDGSSSKSSRSKYRSRRKQRPAKRKRSKSRKRRR